MSAAVGFLIGYLLCVFSGGYVAIAPDQRGFGERVRPEDQEAKRAHVERHFCMALCLEEH
jgi:hypothetical protein